MVVREVVAELWTGAVVLVRLGLGAKVEVDGEQVLFTDLDAEQLTTYLDAFATNLTAANDGVRPSVRVLERVGFPTGRGAAGTVPR